MSCTKSRKSVGVDGVLVHQALQRRAVARVVVFLQRPRRHAVEAHQVGQEQRDPLVHLRPEPGVGGVERVVEIEDPRFDVVESGDVLEGRWKGLGHGFRD